MFAFDITVTSSGLVYCYLSIRSQQESSLGKLYLEREIVDTICQGIATLSGLGFLIPARDICRNATRPTDGTLSACIPM